MYVDWLQRYKGVQGRSRAQNENGNEITMYTKNKKKYYQISETMTIRVSLAEKQGNYNRQWGSFSSSSSPTIINTTNKCVCVGVLLLTMLKAIATVPRVVCKCSKVLKWQQQQQQIGDSVIIADSYDKLITIKALQMWT